MGEKLTVAVAGLVHDHVWSNAAEFARCRETQIVAASDPNKPLTDKFAKQFPDVQVFRDYKKMLDAVEPDIALICTTNAGTMHVVEACAERGVHVVTEKPMASKLSEAHQMARDAYHGRIHLIVNWPTFWSPAIMHLVELVQQGAVGKVFQVRERCAHEGPKEVGCSSYFYDWLYNTRLNGAGALMDYCCYGAALCRYLQGMPRTVTGLKGTLVKEHMTVDDNAVLLLDYPDAISIIEASWTQVGHVPYGIVVNGSEGSLSSDGTALVLADREHPDGKRVRVPRPPVWRSNLANYFARVVREDMPVEGWIDAKISRDAQEILEAGLIATETHKAVRIPVPRKLRK
jgi:predicted dehydrogenase